MTETRSLSLSVLTFCCHRSLNQNLMISRVLTAWLLRLSGTTEILALIAVIMPRSWMEISHAWLGMGEMPDGTVDIFLIRQASYTYGMHGVSLWVLASDVTCFRKLVILNGIGYLLGGLFSFGLTTRPVCPGTGQ